MVFQMSNIIVALLAFLLGLGILISIHEYGHFWVARRMGIKVLRFSIGFGRSLFKWQDKQGTEYVIACIPLGGYVKMLDEREDTVPEDQRQYAFNTQNVWKRIAVVGAGPLFNFLFAIVAYWLTFMIGIKGLVPVVGDVLESSQAQLAGVQVDDEIWAVDGQRTQTWQQVVAQLVGRLGEEGELPLTLKSVGEDHRVVKLSLGGWKLDTKDPDLLQAIGIEAKQPAIPAVISHLLPDEPAIEAGLLEGDKILTINGHKVLNWNGFVNTVQEHPGKLIELGILREGRSIALPIVPRVKEDDQGNQVGYIGVSIDLEKFPNDMVRTIQFGPLEAIGQSLDKVGHYTALTFGLIKKMLFGQLGMETLSGPISIAQGAGQTASIGLAYFLNFLALISISLGVLNLLPIPVLDGGHLLYFAIEVILGKPLSEKAQTLGLKIGLGLILALMSVAFYNDILRFS